MQSSEKNNGQQYVVLEHLTGRDKGFRFWSFNSGRMVDGKIPTDHRSNTLSHDEGGKEIVAYREVWFTDSDSEAIAKCHEVHGEKEMFQHHVEGIVEDLVEAQNHLIGKVFQEE